MRSRKRTGIHMAIVTMAALELGQYAVAQGPQSSADAYIISGTVTKTVSGSTPNTFTIAPVAPSASTGSGSNENAVPSDSQTVFGVEIYNFSNIDVLTVINNTPSTRNADSKTGPGSLLGGSVAWDSLDNDLFCFVSTSTGTASVSCTAGVNTGGLTIHNSPVEVGSFPAGWLLFVDGPLNDSLCSGTENFSGSITLEETQTSGDGTEILSTSTIGMHLVGTATCATPESVPLFTTTYDIAVGVPRQTIEYTGGLVTGGISSAGFISFRP